MNVKHENYHRNIFINCPFDDQYYSLLKALIFTIVYFKFTPRITLESSDSGNSRLEKIITLIKDSKYAIHDISRLKAKSSDEYYRLNMPFELGLDYGLRRFNDSFSDRRTLILETNKYDYMKALSDISDMDIKSHNNDIESLMECLR